MLNTDTQTLSLPLSLSFSKGEHGSTLSGYHENQMMEPPLGSNGTHSQRRTRCEEYFTYSLITPQRLMGYQGKHCFSPFGWAVGEVN